MSVFSSSSSHVRSFFGGLAPAVYALAALKLLLHLLINSNYGYFIDELYYLACAEHLDFGYVDHPPMVAVLAFVARILFGDSLFGLRLLPALAGTLVLLVAARIAKDLGGGAWAQALAALGALFSPVLLFTSTVFSMNIFDVLFCSLALLLILRLMTAEGRALPLWTALGLLFGIGLLNKISVLFLGFGFAVGILLTSFRRRLLEPGPWLCGGIAFVLFAPHLIWQVLNGWPTLEFMHNAATEKNRPMGLGEFVGNMAFEASPASFLLALVGLFWLFRNPGLRLLGWVFLAVFGVMIVGGGKSYYLAIFYPFLFAAGGAALETLLKGRRLALTVATVLVVLPGLALVPMAAPILPIETFIAYQKAILGEPLASSERKSLGPLPQHYADMFGHRELVEQVAAVVADLPEAERKNLVIFADSYAQAGAISLFGPALGLPKAISGHNSYYLWGPGEPAEDATLIVLGDEPEELAPLFDDVQLAGRFSHPYAMPWRNDFPIVICRGGKKSMAEIWPLTKKYV